MSGGSFGYLYTNVDLEDLSTRQDHLSAMADALAHLGYAGDAAEETASLLAQIRAADARIGASTERLRDVWHAMEWWRSGDSGEDRLIEALEKYRGGEPGERSTYRLTAQEAAVVDAMRQQEPEMPDPEAADELTQIAQEHGLGDHGRRCTCGETACESQACDCDSAPCPVDHAGEYLRGRIVKRLSEGMFAEHHATPGDHARAWADAVMGVVGPELERSTSEHLDELSDALRERDEARERLAAVQQLHRTGTNPVGLPTGHCAECGEPVPCPTRRAIGDET